MTRGCPGAEATNPSRRNLHPPAATVLYLCPRPTNPSKRCIAFVGGRERSHQGIDVENKGFACPFQVCAELFRLGRTDAAGERPWLSKCHSLLFLLFCQNVRILISTLCYRPTGCVAIVYETCTTTVRGSSIHVTLCTKTHVTNGLSSCWQCL